MRPDRIPIFDGICERAGLVRHVRLRSLGDSRLPGFKFLFDRVDDQVTKIVREQVLELIEDGNGDLFNRKICKYLEFLPEALLFSDFFR